jgi:hypothetical protein
MQGTRLRAQLHYVDAPGSHIAIASLVRGNLRLKRERHRKPCNCRIAVSNGKWGNFSMIRTNSKKQIEWRTLRGVTGHSGYGVGIFVGIWGGFACGWTALHLSSGSSEE